MNAEVKILNHSIKRLTRLGKLNAKFRTARGKLPFNVFWKIEQDWLEAWTDNNTTSDELRERFRNL